MDRCDQCERKLTCSRCGKQLCRPKQSFKSDDDKNGEEQYCRIVGFYKIMDEKVCIECYR